MKTYNVYGVSDYQENVGEEFPIFINREFLSADAAIKKAKEVYKPSLVVIVREVE